MSRNMLRWHKSPCAKKCVSVPPTQPFGIGRLLATSARRHRSIKGSVFEPNGLPLEIFRIIARESLSVIL